MQNKFSYSFYSCPIYCKFRSNMRILKKIVAGLLLLIILAVTSIYIYLITLKPDYSGTVQLKGLSSKTEVYFDRYGIPHIWGENEEDVYFSLGYVHAQDRLFQMEIMRRIGSGRLAEILGPDMVDVDKFIRTIGIPKVSEESASTYLSSDSLPFQKAALAYLAGINQYLEVGKNPIEFTLLGIKKEKFNPADIFYIGGYMAFSFTEVLKTDPVLAIIKEKLGDKYLNDLAINHPEGTFITPSNNHETELIQQVFSNIIEKLPIQAWTGSNGWVIAPSKSKSGKVLLANDTHIGFSQPSVWYEANINYPGFNFYGNFLAGFPFALTGHNPDAAWGLTMLENDDMDLFREEINPADSSSVLFNGNWEKLKIRKERIGVKDSSDVLFNVRLTRHGPIISDASADLQKKFKEPLSLFWVFNQAANQTLEALYMLSHSNKIESARKAATMIDAPGLNILYGDAKGDIARWTAAKLVKRPAHVNSKLILDGSSEKDEYLGYYSFDENPHMENPATGFVFSSNNQPDSIAGKLYPGYYAPEDRAVRINKFLSQNKKFMVKDFQEFILDDTSDVHKFLAKSITGVIEESGKRLNTKEAEVLTELKKWDGNHNINSNGPTIYYKLLALILHETLNDELGEENYNSILITHLLKNSFIKLINNKHSVWWNNINTHQNETREDIFLKAFYKGIDDLTEQFGNKINNWKWKEAHLLEHVHLIGKKKPFNLVFNVGIFGVEGGNETINNAVFPLTLNGIYKVTSGPAMRRIIDFSDPENSISINPSGQSGYFMSPHYNDQAQMFNEGKFRKQMMDRSEILNNNKGKLILIPFK